MTRAFLLLPLAALVSGCYSSGYSSGPCYPGYLNVYWTPGPSPNAGFEVPGLVAAGFPAELGCAAAGVTGVQVFVGGQIAPCSGGGGFCVDANTWVCGTGGVSVAITAGGTYSVQVDAYDSQGNLKYTSGPVAASASDCGDSAVGVFSQGVDGTLGIDYAFTDLAACQAGSQITWDLRSGLATPFDGGSIVCGGTNPFLVNGGAAVPAGVYTLVNVAEVVGTTSFHAYCNATPVVHAGPESLLVDMAPSTGTCF
ncbi:MAG TPA: hypothetical protein VLD85_08105 [Anaeromyxobacteraceae bacterium]|nr:hypothetical protein [Anaeromyxobacteraceae bacterium]